MITEFFQAVPDEVLEGVEHSNQIGSSLRIHRRDRPFPDLEGIRMAIMSVGEDRLDIERSGEDFDFNGIRQKLYGLFSGNWDIGLADLGHIPPGQRVEDSHFALESVVKQLLQKDIIPIILGGSQDLVYSQYRAYDGVKNMVNFTNVDARFDLGDADKPIHNKSYVGKIVVNKPYNLFNYSNLGYQTYFNPQEEIELMERLFFDAYRLGEVSSKLELVEPVFRDADLVSIDMNAVNAAILGKESLPYPNGFDGKEICALARYAGISDKVSSFGIYEFNSRWNFPSAHMLIAQMLWYFVEGVNFRKNEDTNSAKKEFIRYQVPVEDEVLVFYKSPVSGRWWIEIPFISQGDNKLKRHTLLPCTQEDYINACDQIIPDRWYKTKRKNEI